MFTPRAVIRLIFALAVLVPVTTQASDALDVIGQIEFRTHCAACHGPLGKGDGPVARYLKAPPASLAMLKKDNNGDFPFERVYDIIDGRTVVEAHGSGDMPVWGDRYRAEAEATVGSEHTEQFVRGRILEILFYLYTVQEK